MNHNHSDLKNLTFQKFEFKLSPQLVGNELSMTKWEPPGRHEGIFVCLKLVIIGLGFLFKKNCHCLGYPSNGLVDCLPHFYQFILSLLFGSVNNQHNNAE